MCVANTKARRAVGTDTKNNSPFSYLVAYAEVCVRFSVTKASASRHCSRGGLLSEKFFSWFGEPVASHCNPTCAIAREMHSFRCAPEGSAGAHNFHCLRRESVCYAFKNKK